MANRGPASARNYDPPAGGYATGEHGGGGHVSHRACGGYADDNLRAERPRRPSQPRRTRRGAGGAGHQNRSAPSALAAGVLYERCSRLRAEGAASHRASGRGGHGSRSSREQGSLRFHPDSPQWGENTAPSALRRAGGRRAGAWGGIAIPLFPPSSPQNPPAIPVFSRDGGRGEKHFQDSPLSNPASSPSLWERRTSQEILPPFPPSPNPASCRELQHHAEAVSLELST